jgi:hypothetical protein
MLEIYRVTGVLLKSKAKVKPEYINHARGTSPDDAIARLLTRLVKEGWDCFEIETQFAWRAEPESPSYTSFMAGIGFDLGAEEGQ